MIRIDGSRGEGGGQVLRTALALALVTGQPFEMVKIRAGRSKPGRLRQHLTAVKAAAAVGGDVRCGMFSGTGCCEPTEPVSTLSPLPALDMA